MLPISWVYFFRRTLLLVSLKGNYLACHKLSTIFFPTFLHKLLNLPYRHDHSCRRRRGLLTACIFTNNGKRDVRGFRVIKRSDIEKEHGDSKYEKNRLSPKSLHQGNPTGRSHLDELANDRAGDRLIWITRQLEQKNKVTMFINIVLPSKVRKSNNWFHYNVLHSFDLAI